MKRIPPASTEVLGLDHLVLRVSDLRRSIAFYRAVLGARVERQLRTPRLVQLRIGASLLDLVPGRRGRRRASGGPEGDPGANLDHFAVRVSRLDDAVRAKVAQRLAPFRVVAGPIVERYGAEGYGPSLYFDDPDGNRVELKGPAVRPRIRRERAA